MASSLAVILPTRNRFQLLSRTLRSLERQTYKDFVVYVSDDSSTDETKDHNERSFPNLTIRWIRRNPPFGSIPEHFSALYAEATEDWIALAHDDEVYAPEWLETLVGLMGSGNSSGAPTVMALVGTVVVDIRHGAAKYFEQKDRVPEGVYSVEELKRLWLFHGCHFPANGFIVSKIAAMQVGAMNPGYEQFDFEWMMRVAELGATVVSERLLNTYMMHPQNTVGSASYLRRYFDQKNPSIMELEWLETLVNIPTEERSRRRVELQSNVGRSRFRTFLKAVATGDRALSCEINALLQKDASLSRSKRRLGSLLSLPVVFCMASLVMRFALKMAAMRKHSTLLELTPSRVEMEFGSLPVEGLPAERS